METNLNGSANLTFVGLVESDFACNIRYFQLLSLLQPLLGVFTGGWLDLVMETNIDQQFLSAFFIFIGQKICFDAESH
jgi:hypothetical protein